MTDLLISWIGNRMGVDVDTLKGLAFLAFLVFGCSEPTTLPAALVWLGVIVGAGAWMSLS